MTMEQKRIVVPIEAKAVDDEGRFSGYASVFGVEDYDGDVIMRGAFSESLAAHMGKGKMPKMLWQHDPSQIVGKWLSMREDEKGLYAEGKLIMDVQQGREAYALMKEGELDGLSIGFNIVDAGSNGTHGRVINKLDLWETSLVTWGANPEALITAVKAKNNIRDFELFLRESGFSRSEAVGIAAKGFSAIGCQSESDGESEENTALIEALKNLTKTMRIEQ